MAIITRAHESRTYANAAKGLHEVYLPHLVIPRISGCVSILISRLSVNMTDAVLRWFTGSNAVVSNASLLEVL